MFKHLFARKIYNQMKEDFFDLGIPWKRSNCEDYLVVLRAELHRHPHTRRVRRAIEATDVLLADLHKQA